MTRTRWACLVIAAVSLAVIAMCVLDRPAEPDRAPPADTPPPDTVRTGARAETVEQIERGARVPVEAEPDPARLVVRVQDRTGGPVAGATVSRVPAAAQWLSAEGRRRVGPPSDASGVVELALADLAAARDDAPDPSHRFVVEHPDHLPAELAIEPPEVVVTLTRAETLVVECVSDGGDPVAGVAIAASRFAEFEALRTAVMHVLLDGSVPARGPCAGDRAVCAGVTDDRGIAEIRGCAPGSYAFVAGHELWVPVEGAESPTGIEVPGPPLRLVMAPLVGACIEPDGTSPVLSINVDWDRSQFDGGPLSRRGGIAAALHMLGPDTSEGLRVQVPSAELRRAGKAPEVRYSVLFPSGWTHVTVPMRPLADGIEPVRVAPPDGPDRTGTLVVGLAGVPEPPAIPTQLPPLMVMGDDGGGGTFDRFARCGEPLRVPAGEYQFLSANPWIDADARVRVERGEQARVVLPLRRELRPCRLEPVGPPGAILPGLDLRIGPRDAGRRVLRLRSWRPGLEHENPESSAVQWLPVGEVVVEVNGRGVVASQTAFDVGLRYDGQVLPIRVELSR